MYKNKYTKYILVLLFAALAALVFFSFFFKRGESPVQDNVLRELFSDVLSDLDSHQVNPVSNEEFDAIVNKLKSNATIGEDERDRIMRELNNK